MNHPWKTALLAVVLAACGRTATMSPPAPAAVPLTAGSAELDPASTLQPDAFDRPAPIAIAEAGKSAPGVQGHHHEHVHEAATPAPAPAEPPAARGAPAAAVLYVCPMHPDVTSATPGTCPKCGMTLVVKKER